MFRWTDEATEAQLAHLIAGLDALPTEVPGVSRYTHGPDAGINDGNHQYVIVADFASVDEYLVYRDHPWHRELIADRIRPVMADRVAVQYEVTG
jgi:hypothetical protein